MQVLKSIEDKFDFFPFGVKLAFFLFPILAFTFLTYFIYEGEHNKLYIPKKIISVKSIKMKESVVEILKEIEKYTFEHEIEVHLLKKDKSYIKFEVFSSLRKRILFLNYLEGFNSFSKIHEFKFFKDSLIVEVEFKKFYKKEKFILTNELSFIENKKIEKKLVLQAIVGKSVLVNGYWFKIDDKIDSFILKKIEKNSILLENRFKKLVLKLHKNEDI